MEHKLEKMRNEQGIGGSCGVSKSSETICSAEQSLYLPQMEHDACGVGFVAHLKGEKSFKIIERKYSRI